MLRLTELKLPLDHPPEALAPAIVARLGIAPDELVDFAVARRANDARRKSAILMVYSVDVTLRDEAAVLARFADDRHVQPTPDTDYRFVAQAPANRAGPRPVVVGAGPCGLFVGLILAQMGFRPIILDRGKVVRERTKDTWGLWRRGVLNPESNVQFGEGGAGTFSDGKLYSQIKDPRHLGRKVLTEFVKAGAAREILTEAHPHIGTFRLVTMVESLRETIEGLGGEYRFEHRVEDLDIETGADGTRRVRGLHLQTGDYLEADHVVLAVGHSARDTFADAPRARRAYRGQALLDRRADRASAILDRPGALRRLRRPSRSRRRRLSACRITARTAGRSTASACAPAAPWWRRRRRPAASPPTA